MAPEIYVWIYVWIYVCAVPIVYWLIKAISTLIDVGAVRVSPVGPQ